MIEDLGPASDLMRLYSCDRVSPADLTLLCQLARELHAIPLSCDERSALRNEAMRELNHEHIFDIPLRAENGLDLEAHTKGLTAAAEELKENRDYVACVSQLGRVYLAADGPALLHGDYYPGSFLRAERGLVIIDPEFGFPGPVEFDLGVLAAHLSFAGEGVDIVDRVIEAYGEPVERSLLEGFAGSELMRRLLGVSQLPLQADLDRKRGWLERSRRWVLGA